MWFLLETGYALLESGETLLSFFNDTYKIGLFNPVYLTGVELLFTSGLSIILAAKLTKFITDIVF